MTRLGGITTTLVTLSMLAGCGDDAAAPTDAGSGGADAGGEVDGGDTDAGPPPFEPDSYCPGGPDCPDEGDGVLHVGAAALTITPAFDDTTEILTVDVDGDVHYEPGDGDEFRDTNGNGAFEGIWLAGFGSPRPAAGVHDDVWVRAIALRQNETTVVLAAVDAVGWFKDDVDVIRGMIADADVDYLMMAATHDHQAPDTLGIWGLSESQTGVYPEHMAFIHARAAQAIRDAVAALEPASITYASFFLRDSPGGVLRYHGDQRDPIVVDDEVRVLRFASVGSDDTIATMVNWAAHPEFLWDENDQISSDYPHWLRLAIEEGTVGPDGTMTPGLGGVAVFFPGALGGQIGPNRITPAQWDGTPVMNRTLEAAQAVGSQIGWLVLDALGPTGGSVTEATADLAFRNRTFLVDVQNRGYHVAILNELFQREAFNWDPELALIPGENEPDIETEIAVIDIGRAQLITAPGELHPELFVGYDGYTPAGQTITTDGNPNPPDMTAAPGPPYLRDLARDDADHVFLLGLGGDMLGYLIPSFNYELHPTNPYLDEAEGHHYEETNSVGVDGWPTVEREMTALLGWEP